MMSLNFDLMTNNTARKLQWISDYTYAKASQYELGTQVPPALAAPQVTFNASTQEDKMTVPTAVRTLVTASMLSTLSQAQTEEARFVRAGLVSVSGTYSPETGLTVSSPANYAAYRRVNPTDNPTNPLPGGKADLERWKRFSEEILASSELPRGYTLEIVPEGQPTYRIRTETHPMWRPGQISWLCWVPERIKVRSLRLFKDGACLGEAYPKDSGFVPHVDFQCVAGTLAWKAPIGVSVMQIVGSDDGGKTWRIYGHGQEQSIHVDLSSASQWVFAIEGINQDDGRFFRKEIQVEP